MICLLQTFETINQDGVERIDTVWGCVPLDLIETALMVDAAGDCPRGISVTEVCLLLCLRGGERICGFNLGQPVTWPIRKALGSR